jgi:hypothetical protein
MRLTGVNKMKYINSFDIWNIPNELIKYIQPGQHVYAGTKDNKGIYQGIKKNGIIVVAWKGNIDNKKNKREYINKLRNYAKS